MTNTNLPAAPASNFDFAKISKAVAGGISGAITAAGGTGAAYFSVPADQISHLPSWIPTLIVGINAIVGFAIGFAIVYQSPPNTATPAIAGPSITTTVHTPDLNQPRVVSKTVTTVEPIPSNKV